MKTSTDIINVDNIPDEIQFGTKIDIKNQNVTYLTHGFHKYPGKFIPQIPQWGITNYTTSKSDVIYDPFCGSGTTLVEAMHLGYNTVGTDIDPLSCLMSKVKSTPLNPEYFKVISEWVQSNKNVVQPEFTPATDNLEHWFTDEAIKKLSKIRTTVDLIPEKFSDIDNIQDYYDAFIVLLSSIIRRVSNADNQSQKTYVSGTKPKKPAEVFNLFERQNKLYLERFKELYSVWDGQSESNIIKTDGETDVSYYLDQKVDLIITSPPYIKSIDYVYNQMVELFWVGDLFNVDTQPKQNIKRRDYTGTTLVYKKEYEDLNIKDIKIDSNLLVSTIEEILHDEKNGDKHAFIVNNYFEFMNNHFESMFNILKENSYYIVVIGNSSVSDVEVDTASLLVELGENNGFYLDNKWSYVIKNHFMGFNRAGRGGKIREDHVLIFKKH